MRWLTPPKSVFLVTDGVIDRIVSDSCLFGRTGLPSTDQSISSWQPFPMLHSAPRSCEGSLTPLVRKKKRVLLLDRHTTKFHHSGVSSNNRTWYRPSHSRPNPLLFTPPLPPILLFVAAALPAC